VYILANAITGSSVTEVLKYYPTKIRVIFLVKKSALLYRHWNSVQAVRPIGPVEVKLYPFLTKALDGGEGSASHPGRSLSPGKTQYPLYRRLGGPQVWSGEVQKISPQPGFDPGTVQPVASRCTDYATGPSIFLKRFNILRVNDHFWGGGGGIKRPTSFVCSLTLSVNRNNWYKTPCYSLLRFRPVHNIGIFTM